MKKLIFLFLVLQIVSIKNFAQNTLGKQDDLARISLATYIPQMVEPIPDGAISLLSNKLGQLVTQGGMGGSSYGTRFIITCNVNVITKDITPTAPPMQAYTLNVTLYIGDGVSGTKFSSTSLTCKGVGVNETKAYISAFNSINFNNPEVKNFIENGKTKIIEYYNAKCDFIIKESETLASQNKFEQAIFNLTQVPDVCKDCYMKCMTAVEPIFKKQIDRKCSELLNKAKSVWAAGQSYDAAESVGQLISQIDPNAACFKDAQVFTDAVGKRVKELDTREWKFILKQQQDDVDIQKATIKAARDIGVAYGNNQPKSITTTYNVIGWW